MRNYKEYPEEGELVVIEIKDVNPHSVYAEMEGYEHEGMIHISEVSRSWVRDIKKHVKEGEKEVAQVLKVDKDKEQISISLKRVNDKQKREKMQEWKKEEKAEKLLKKVGEELGKDEEELYEKVAFPFQKKFDGTFNGFEKALVDKEKVEEVLGNDIFKAVEKVAKENISTKNAEMESVMNIEVPGSDGIETIRKALDVGEKAEVSYLSAPKYKIKAWGLNRSKCKKKMKETVKDIREEIESNGGTFSIEKA